MQDSIRHSVPEIRTILVTCARYRIALAVAASLSRAGYRVIMADSLAWPLGRLSRYASAYAQYQDPTLNEEGFIRDLLEIGRKYNVDHIMPTFQETALIAKYQDRFQAAGISSFLAKKTLINQANDKGQVTDIAENLGISVPATWYPRSLKEVQNLAPALPYPVILKPRGGKAGAGQTIAHTSEELLAAWQELQPDQIKEGPLLQQVIKGPDLCVAHLYHKGRCLASYSNRIRRHLQRVHSIEKESRIHEAAMHASRRLLDHLKWHGIAELDFILDEETGQPYLLEINPRYWGSIQNALEAGVDFPALAMKSLSGRSFPEPVQRDGITSIWLYPYLLSAAQALLKGKIGSFFDHLFNPFSKHIRLDEFSQRDPVPALLEPFLGCANLIRTGGLSLDSQPSYRAGRQKS